MSRCAVCDLEYDDAYDSCPRCARGVRPGSRMPVLDLRTALAVAGSALLVLGVFVPLVNLPFVGGVNYILNGRGDGVIILLLALVPVVLVVTKRFRGLLVTGGLAAALTTYTFVRLSMKVAELKDSMYTDLAGNPFIGIAEMAMESVQLQVGGGLSSLRESRFSSWLVS